MHISKFVLSGALAAAVMLPLAASAQQSPGGSVTEVTSGASTGARHHHGRGAFMRALRSANLSDDQRSQIGAIMAQYRQEHPKGSAPDPQAAKAMRQEVLGILTPSQRQTVKQQMRAQRQQGEAQGRNNVFPHDNPAPAETNRP